MIVTLKAIIHGVKVRPAVVVSGEHRSRDVFVVPLTIPNHKTIKSSTLRTICRQSAIARDDFPKAFDES
jgi:uncharacterized protein YifN (PemK superfamily)